MPTSRDREGAILRRRSLTVAARIEFEFILFAEENHLHC